MEKGCIGEENMHRIAIAFTDVHRMDEGEIQSKALYHFFPL